MKGDLFPDLFSFPRKLIVSNIIKKLKKGKLLVKGHEKIRIYHCKNKLIFRHGNLFGHFINSSLFTLVKFAVRIKTKQN
jgi:hypothetical protein